MCVLLDKKRNAIVDLNRLQMENIAQSMQGFLGLTKEEREYHAH